MKQNLFQKMGNQVSKLWYKEPITDLEKDRTRNIAVKEALEKISKTNQSEKFAEIDMRRLIDRYGHERVANVLSNSVNFRKEGEIDPENKVWASQYPTSAVHSWGRSEEYLKKFPVDNSKDYAANTSGAFLNWAMEYTQKKEIKRNFVQAEDYEPLGEGGLKGTVIALNPNAIRNPFAKQNAQLWVTLEDEFNDSNKIMARNIASGVEMALDKSMILGEVKEDRIPKKAKEKVEKLFHQPTKEEELYENGRPFLGKTSKNYKTLTMNDNVILVAEQKKNQIHFSTWVMENNEPSHKHDFGTSYEAAVQDFGVRAGFVKVTPIINLTEYLKEKEQAQEKAKEQVEEEENSQETEGSSEKSKEKQAQQVQHPNLTTEEMAIYLALCQKMNGPSPEEAESTLEGVINEVEEVMAEENVKEWRESAPIQEEYQEQHYGYPIENIGYYEKANEIPFEVRGNSRLLSKMEDVSLIVTLTKTNEVLFTVCHMDTERQRLTPLAQPTEDFQLAKSMFAVEAGLVITDYLTNQNQTEEQGFDYENMSPPPEYSEEMYYEEYMASGGER